MFKVDQQNFQCLDPNTTEVNLHAFCKHLLAAATQVGTTGFWKILPDGQLAVTYHVTIVIKNDWDIFLIKLHSCKT